MESALYEGEVVHVRREPFTRAFRRRLVLFYLDLGELDLLAGRGVHRWLFSVERPALASFRRRDHLGDPARPLDACVRDLVAERSGRRPEGPIRLLTHPRQLGFGFNPVSFFYCFARDGRRLEAVVAEVNNTPWGERHAYVLTSTAGAAPGGELRARAPKALHVSPFLGMDLEHVFRFSVPGDALRVEITDERAGTASFHAALRLTRRPLETAALGRALLRHPFLPGRILAGIYTQALRLWWRGAPFHPHPGSRPAGLRTETP